MDISDDLDDLPEIILDSSLTEAEKTFSFEMPDASVIAAQRRLALEQEAEIKKFKEQSFCRDVDPEEAVPLEILNELKKVPAITLPVEHPGILLKDLNRMEIVGNLEGPRAVFLMDLIDATELSEGLDGILKWYIESIELTILECPESFEADDIHCNVIALSIIYLNKNCRVSVDIFKVQNLTLDLLNRSGRAYQSDEFLHNLTKHLLKIVPHVHNRICLARFLNNANLHISSGSGQSELFSRKLSLAIMISSLRELLGHRKLAYSNGFTVKDLKDTIVNAPKWALLNPYDQYLMMMAVMNLLTTYNVMDVGKTDNDESTLKELMLFFASIKSNEKWNNGEFLKVKNLIAKTKLFVQGKPFDHRPSPKKQRKQTTQEMTQDRSTRPKQIVMDENESDAHV